MSWSLAASLVVVCVIMFLGDLVSRKASSKVSSLIVIALCFMIGFWTVFPKGILDTSMMNSLREITMLYILLQVGARFNLQLVKKDWRVVVTTLAAVAGILVIVGVAGSLIFGRETALVAIPPLTGGGLGGVGNCGRRGRQVPVISPTSLLSGNLPPCLPARWEVFCSGDLSDGADCVMIQSLTGGESMERQETDRIRELMAAVRSVTDAHEKYLSRARDYLDGEKLYMREAHFAIAVGHSGEVTMSELAHQLEITPGAVSQLAQRMEKKGYVERVTCAEDKRKNIVRLTEKGQALYEAHEVYDRAQYQVIARSLARYTPEQLDLFIEMERELSRLLCSEEE